MRLRGNAVGARLAGVLFVLVATLSSANVHAEDLQLPNLAPRIPYDIQLGLPDDDTPGEKALRFTTGTMNIGQYPLDIFASELISASDTRFKAGQCVSWAGLACIDRREVGEMYFENHVSHLHFHYDLFALYELRRIVDGQVDQSDAGLVAGGEKRSFCMQNTDIANPTNDLAQDYLNNPPGIYVACYGLGQGISPGWDDEYDAGVYGQQIVIDGVPDGIYAVQITLNPDGRLFETTRADDRTSQRIQLYANGTQVKVLD